MQRRHFELIAEIIRKELQGECREKAAYAFAYILPTTNGKFDSQRFLKACNVKAFAIVEAKCTNRNCPQYGGVPSHCACVGRQS
jgi:hypothetical protein